MVQDDRNVSVVLEGFEECQLNKTACWTPAFIVEKRNEKQNTFMVFVRSNGVDQTLSCFCVLLSNSKEMADNFGVKYSISGGSEEVIMVTILAKLEFQFIIKISCKLIKYVYA